MQRGMLFIMAWSITAVALAQTTGRDQLLRGTSLWEQRLSKSAIAAFEDAARDPSAAAEAHEALGRIYMFKGWQQEGVFPGWRDGVVRYQTVGSESHGDSLTRVAWYIDQLKR